MIRGFALFPILALLACSSFQKGYRQTMNKELEGQQAPPIEGGTWLPAGAVGQAEFDGAKYRVLAFFKPT